MFTIKFTRDSVIKPSPESSTDLDESRVVSVKKGTVILCLNVGVALERGHFHVILSDDSDINVVDGVNTAYVFHDHVDYDLPSQDDPGVRSPASSYRLSGEGVELIKHYEGLRLTQYMCAGDVETIGIGATRWFDGGPIQRGQTCTKQQALQLFDRDIKVFEQGVAELVTVPLTNGEFDALISLAYNVGLDAIRRSRMLRKLNSGDYPAAILEFLDWNKAGGKEVRGLTLRRQSEQIMWNSGEFEALN